MGKSSAILVVLIGFALLSTILAGGNYFAPSTMNKIVTTLPSNIPGGTVFGSTLQLIDQHAGALAPTSWLLLASFVVWRGRVRSSWLQAGFDSDVFQLFVTSRGARTRLKMLSALTVPKYRLQLAREMNLTWRTVDRHMAILNRCGMVNMQAAYGNIAVYSTTNLGRRLIGLAQPLQNN